MRLTIGALAVEHVAVGLVENNKVLGSLHVYPEKGKELAALREMPAENIAECIRQQIKTVAKGEKIETIGIGFPGIIREGMIEESPNLQQVKGFNLGAHLTSALRDDGIPASVFIFNDADVMAAGIAATRGHLDRFIRAWTLGDGIGFGRYPWKDGVWEGGHSVVTLDPKEHFCGCGGHGHLEGIMGYRSMRLRFLDMEPEEVFENAGTGDDRCATFFRLWHRALAAATATSVHMDGPGKFFISGPNAKYIDLRLLNLYLHEMVKMIPLQGTLFEVISVSDEIAVIGAAVNAEHAAL